MAVVEEMQRGGEGGRNGLDEGIKEGRKMVYMVRKVGKCGIVGRKSVEEGVVTEGEKD